jgi:uncharacterized membrane protein YkvA (DUF1232 family)
LDRSREGEKREPSAVKEGLLFVPNVAKLLGRLAQDSRVPRSTKWGMALFGLYLANPIDLIPDWIPILGFLDDVVLIAFVGRWVARTVPPELIREHWDGQIPFPDVVDKLTGAARRDERREARRRKT